MHCVSTSVNWSAIIEWARHVIYICLRSVFKRGVVILVSETRNHLIIDLSILLASKWVGSNSLQVTIFKLITSKFLITSTYKVVFCYSVNQLIAYLHKTTNLISF